MNGTVGLITSTALGPSESLLTGNVYTLPAFVREALETKHNSFDRIGTSG
jgi:hypothetical protein